MNKKQLSTSFLILISCFIYKSYGQNKTIEVCSGPTDKYLTRNSGDMIFHVNFDQNSWSSYILWEKVVFVYYKKNGNVFPESKGKTYFTANAPYPIGKPLPMKLEGNGIARIDDTDREFRSPDTFYLRYNFFKTADSLKVYVTRIEGDSVYSAGPVYFYTYDADVTKHRTPCFIQDSILATLKKTEAIKKPPISPDSSWSFSAPKQITIRPKGNNYIEKNEAINSELFNSHIISSSEFITLLEKINPALNNIRSFSSDFDIVLPKFPETGIEREKELQAKYRVDSEIDGNANSLFRKIIDTCLSLLTTAKEFFSEKEVLLEFTDINYALSAFRNSSFKKLTRAETDILNYATESFIELISQSINNKITADTSYLNLIQLYKNDLFSIVLPLFNYPLQNTRQKGGTSLYKNYHFKADKIDDPSLRVCFYVFDDNGSAPANTYTIYCVPPFFFNLFKNKKISLKDLEKRNYSCDSPASVTGKKLLSTFTYQIIIESKAGQIAIRDKPLVVSEILERSPDKRMSELYSVPLSFTKDKITR